jgi:hypothetical protein
MAEEKVADIATLKSAGKPERVNFQNNKPVEKAPVEKTDTTTPAAGNEAGDGGETKKPEAAAAAPAITEDILKGLTDDQLKSVLKGKGIDFENFDELKSKLTTPAAPVELTAEQKAEQEKAFEKRMLDFHLERGGTPEEFVALKQVASMDLKQLSVAKITKEMKAEGFDDEQIAQVLRERYYQLNPDEIEKAEDEPDEDFNKKKELLKKKVSYGSKKLENHALYTKKDAEETLNELREAIKAKDAAEKKEIEFSSKVDELSKKLSREITFELGEINDQKIDPVKFNVSEADITEVANVLKDKAQRNNFLFNEDKTLNYSKLMEVMLRNKYLESALKAGYIEGGNRQVEVFKKTFPGSPHGLGVGGAAQSNKNGTPGNITKAGKPERVRPNN